MCIESQLEKKGRESLSKEIMAEDFQIWGKNEHPDPRSQKSIKKKRNLKKSTPRQIIIKLSKDNKTERLLKRREK